MPRKTNTEKDKRGQRRTMENRTPRPKPKIDFIADALDFLEGAAIIALGLDR